MALSLLDIFCCNKFMCHRQIKNSFIQQFFFVCVKLGMFHLSNFNFSENGNAVDTEKEIGSKH